MASESSPYVTGLLTQSPFGLEYYLLNIPTPLNYSHQVLSSADKSLAWISSDYFESLLRE